MFVDCAYEPVSSATPKFNPNNAIWLVQELNIVQECWSDNTCVKKVLGDAVAVREVLRLFEI